MNIIYGMLIKFLKEFLVKCQVKPIAIQPKQLLIENKRRREPKLSSFQN